MAAAFDQGRVRLWDLVEGGPPRLFADLNGYTENLAFSPDSLKLAAGGYYDKVAVWDIRTIQQIGQMRARHADRVTALAISADGSFAASGGWDREIRVWRTDGATAGKSTLTGHYADIYGLAFTADGGVLVSAGSHAGPLYRRAPEIIRWDLTSDPPQPMTPLPAPPAETGLYGLMKQIERLQGGTFGSDPGTSALRAAFPMTVAQGAIARVQGVDAEGARGIVGILPISGYGPRVALRTDHRSEIAALALSIDATTLASAGIDRRVEIWDVASRRRLRQVTGAGPCVSAQFSASGSHLAAACDAEILVLPRPFDDTDVVRLVEEDMTIERLAISPDGARLAAVDSNGEMTIWDIASRRIVGASFGTGKRVSVIAFGPSGRFLYTGDEGGEVIAWDLGIEQWKAVACRIAGRNLTPPEWTRFLDDRPYHATCISPSE